MNSYNEKISYLSGLFDGEGCIMYKKYSRKRPNRPRPYECWVIRMELSMTNKPVVDYFQEVLGIGTVNFKLKKTPNSAKRKWKDQWRWACCHRQALKVCKLFLPYSKVKKEKIEKIINHYEGNTND